MVILLLLHTFIYNRPGVAGNCVKRTNIPNIRVAYRWVVIKLLINDKCYVMFLDMRL